MQTTRRVALLVMFVTATATAEDFKPLFNGTDLSGWVRVNCAPDTFIVRDELIVCSGKPNGVMHSVRQYENFILELEWRHVEPKGNAGLFIWSDPLPIPGSRFPRSIEVQILDGLNTPDYTSHGDVFAIQGATMKPDKPHRSGWMRSLPRERRCKPAGQWNHYRLLCNNGNITLSVNGKVVTEAFSANPRQGYLCLESEGSEVHFRNIRVKELPSTKPKPNEIAAQARGFQSLFTGLDFDGWKADTGHKGHWLASDGVISYDGKSTAQDKNLWTEREYGDFVLIADWRFSGKPLKQKRPVILPSGESAQDGAGNPKQVEVLDAGDSGIYLRGSSKSQVNIWCWPVGSGEVYGYRTDQSLPADVRRGVTPTVKADRELGQWNRFEITMQGERLTVVLNGQTVIRNARLPGVPRRGRIALQHHGDPIQFANLYLRELNP